MWWQLAPVEDKIVVSEIGEQWSPNTAPANTADNIGNIMVESLPIAMSAAIGNIIPKVPQLVPVEKAVMPARINSTTGNNSKGIVSIDVRNLVTYEMIKSNDNQQRINRRSVIKDVIDLILENNKILEKTNYAVNRRKFLEKYNIKVTRNGLITVVRP